MYRRLNPAPVLGVSEVLGVPVITLLLEYLTRTTCGTQGVEVVVVGPVVTTMASAADVVVTIILQLPDLASDGLTGEGTAGPETTPFGTVTPV